MAAELQSGVEASLLPHSPRLRRNFSDPGLESSYLAYLAERIRRNPRELRAHVERVLLRAARRERAGLLAALVDLQIALGAAGRDLRGRLLARAEPCLDGASVALLRGCLATGLDACDVRAAVPGACLATPVAGSMQLVRRRAGKPGATASPLGLAREAIAAGDVRGAQRLLEAALEQDPGHPELGRELLELYRRTGWREEFLRTRTKLLGRRMAGAADWDRLEGDMAERPRLSAPGPTAT